MEWEPKELALEAARILREKRAEDLLVLDIEHLTVLASYMVVCSGHSVVQVKALADEMEEKLPDTQPIRREGYAQGRWIVLDYGSVLVHIFHEQEREYYHMERLWMDGTNAVPLPEDGAEG